MSGIDPYAFHRIISAVQIISSNGDVLISRVFREEVKASVSDVFTAKIINVPERELKNPILTIGSTSFLHLREGDVYYVAITRHNADACNALQFLRTLINVLKKMILPKDTKLNTIDSGNIMDNFVVIYELLDRMIYQGYVQELTYEELTSNLLFPVTQASIADINIKDKLSEITTEVSNVPLKIINEEVGGIPDNVVELLLNERVITKEGHTSASGQVISHSPAIQLPHGIEAQFELAPLHLITCSNATVELTEDQGNVSANISKPKEALFNYSTTIKDENIEKIPLSATATYKQLWKDKFEVSVSINPSLKFPKVKPFDVKVNINIPENSTITVLSNEKENEQFSTNGNEYTWTISGKNPVNELERRLRILCISNDQGNLSSWISKFKGVSLQYITEGYNPSEMELFNFTIPGSQNDKVYKIIQVRTEYVYNVKV